MQEKNQINNLLRKEDKFLLKSAFGRRKAIRHTTSQVHCIIFRNEEILIFEPKTTKTTSMFNQNQHQMSNVSKVDEFIGRSKKKDV